MSFGTGEVIVVHSSKAREIKLGGPKRNISICH